MEHDNTTQQSPTEHQPSEYDMPRYDYQGPPPHPYEQHRRPLKSTAFAVVLSAIMPGLGQVYVGYYRHAFLYIAIFASTIAVLSSSSASGLEPLLGIFLGFFYFYQLIDAARKASLVNQALRRGSAEAVVNEELPAAGGSVFGGAALLIIGVLALSHNVLDMSMAWLEDWWPLALVIVGGWIIFKSRKSKDEN